MNGGDRNQYHFLASLISLFLILSIFLTFIQDASLHCPLSSSQLIKLSLRQGPRLRSIGQYRQGTVF